jgi:hypothetical protein
MLVDASVPVGIGIGPAVYHLVGAAGPYLGGYTHQLPLIIDGSPPPLFPPATVASVLIHARPLIARSLVKPLTLPLVKVMVSPPMPG